MRISLSYIVVPFLLLTFSASAKPGIDFNDYKGVVHQRPCFSGPFGDYTGWRESLINRNPEHKTEKQKETARQRFSKNISRQEYNYYKENLTCAWFQYLVDGKKVNGYVIKKKSNALLPVLIYNRGGNGNYGGMVFGNFFRRLFPIADQGFVIIGSQYRGTFMKERDAAFDDQFGGADVDDVLELLNIIPYIEGADASRVGIFGSSRGGMQTLLALKAGANVKAAAVMASPTDLQALLSDRPDMENVYKERIPGYGTNNGKVLHQRSAVKWVKKLNKNVPLLVLHGQNDTRVNANQSLILATILQQHNHPYKLVIYPRDDHGLRLHRDEVNNELTSWFTSYLQDDKSGKPD